MGDRKKRAGYLFYGNDLHEAPNAWAQSARHAAGLPLGAEDFLGLVGFICFLNEAVYFLFF